MIPARRLQPIAHLQRIAEQFASIADRRRATPRRCRDTGGCRACPSWCAAERRDSASGAIVLGPGEAGGVIDRIAMREKHQRIGQIEDVPDHVAIAIDRMEGDRVAIEDHEVAGIQRRALPQVDEEAAHADRLRRQHQERMRRDRVRPRQEVPTAYCSCGRRMEEAADAVGDGVSWKNSPCGLRSKNFCSNSSVMSCE